MEPKSPALQVDSLSFEPPGKPKVMVVIVISKIQTYPVKFTGILILLKWLLIDNNKPVYTLVLTPTVFAGTYPDITHSTPTPKTSESGKRQVIAFLPRSKRPLISWLQSPSAVILLLLLLSHFSRVQLCAAL